MGWEKQQKVQRGRVPGSGHMSQKSNDALLVFCKWPLYKLDLSVFHKQQQQNSPAVGKNVQCQLSAEVQQESGIYGPK